MMEIRCTMAVKTNAVVSIMTNQFLVDHIHNLLKRQRTMSVKPHLTIMPAVSVSLSISKKKKSTAEHITL